MIVWYVIIVNGLFVKLLARRSVIVLERREQKMKVKTCNEGGNVDNYTLFCIGTRQYIFNPWSVETHYKGLQATKNTQVCMCANIQVV